MRSETSTGRSALPPRAAIARLTLELRAARDEAVAAEADDAAREQMRTRLQGLMDERRRALDAELAKARAEAEASLAAARRAASVMVARAAPAIDGVALSIQPPIELEHPLHGLTARPEQPAPRAAKLLQPPGEIVRPDDIITSPVPIIPTVVVAEAQQPYAPAATPSREIERVQPSGAPTSSNLVIDAESFAAVFATVIATLLDERALGARATHGAAPVAAPVPAKQSFWTYARHPDVILLGLTTVIVLVVLAAWLA